MRCSTGVPMAMKSAYNNGIRSANLFLVNLMRI